MVHINTVSGFLSNLTDADGGGFSAVEDGDGGTAADSTPRKSAMRTMMTAYPAEKPSLSAKTSRRSSDPPSSTTPSGSGEHQRKILTAARWLATSIPDRGV